MSFADREHVIEVIEKMLLNSWPHSLGDIKTPFQRISYEDAMEMFGSESPDLRIPHTVFIFVVFNKIACINYF